MTSLTVSTVAPALTDKELAASHSVVISVRKNERGDTKLEPHERARFIVIPELTVPSVPSQFTLLVLERMYALAKEQLTSLLSGDNWNDREVPAHIWNVDSLLAFWSRTNESTRLSAAGIEVWFSTSTIRERIMKMDAAKQPAALKKYLDEGFAKCAAPVIPFNEKECADLLALLDKESNQEHTILKQMAARLRNRINEMRKQRELSFADDLPE